MKSPLSVASGSCNELVTTIGCVRESHRVHKKPYFPLLLLYHGTCDSPNFSLKGCCVAVIIMFGMNVDGKTGCGFF